VGFNDTLAMIIIILMLIIFFIPLLGFGIGLWGIFTNSLFRYSVIIVGSLILIQRLRSFVR
jgi:hypothetical protein